MAVSTTQVLTDRIGEFEEAIVEAVAAIDQADGSRVGLQETLDSVRETLGDIYGETLTDDVNEFLGIETSSDETTDDEITDDEITDDEITDDEDEIK